MSTTLTLIITCPDCGRPMRDSVIPGQHGIRMVDGKRLNCIGVEVSK
jgi:hypothetical protein